MARSARVSVEVFADLRADVGEAPHWDQRSMTLLFVDLTGGTIFRYDPSGTELDSFSVGQEVDAVVPRRDGGLVLAVRDGIAVASNTGDNFELTAPVERDTPGNRMNDAKCDPAGRLLAGTTAFDFAPQAAALYRVEPDWSFDQIVRDVTQSNGIAWSPDGRSCTSSTRPPGVSMSSNTTPTPAQSATGDGSSLSNARTGYPTG
jgi:sugar lactone lactonase YvrE